MGSECGDRGGFDGDAGPVAFEVGGVPGDVLGQRICDADVGVGETSNELSVENDERFGIKVMKGKLCDFMNAYIWGHLSTSAL